MILELNTKSDFIEHVKGHSTGIFRSYLLNNNPQNKLDEIIYCSNVIIEKTSITPLIEVKYNLGSRNKRIEIVFMKDDIYYLCKISNNREFDKDYFELLNIITDMKRSKDLQHIKIGGVLFFTHEYNFQVVEDFMMNREDHFKHIHINDL